MKKILLPLIAVGLLAGRQTLLAATEDFTISLDAPQEGDPADTSAASGSGTLTLDTAANTLTFNNIIWSGLESDSTVSHIHGPAAAGVNANPIYFLSAPGTFTTTGAAIRNGTISGTLTLTDPPGVGPAYSIANQISDLEGGLWYINIHSSVFPNGEIRGQILPVPEPSILALFGLSASALLWHLRRRGG
ncbi:MAG: hypothetical protein DME22_05405 [Verrucomicrobia bacterium]|nr:MAG: hypothetical protein DME22_05405 [Verrucomicrobiota bacterium]